MNKISISEVATGLMLTSLLCALTACGGSGGEGSPTLGSSSQSSNQSSASSTSSDQNLGSSSSQAEGSSSVTSSDSSDFSSAASSLVASSSSHASFSSIETSSASSSSSVAISYSSINSVGSSSSSASSVTETDLAHLWGGPITAARKQTLDNLVLSSAKQPHAGHPRLYGSNSEWSEKNRLFDELDPGCAFDGAHNGVGTVKNMQAMWDVMTRGGRRCANQQPATPTAHALAQPYMDGTLNIGIRGNYTDRLRLLHLIRRELYCHEQQRTDCQFTANDTQRLVQKYIAGEVSRLRSAPRSSQVPEWADEIGYPANFRFITYWHRTSEKFFDLGAEPEFKNWTLFLDTFWDHPALNQSDRNFIAQELEYEIDSYLMSDQKKHWNLYGGNNWTPVLNSAAMHWALLFYYEKPSKARQVLEIALLTNWLHRDYYLNDGGYIEGSSYLSTSYSPMISMHLLLRASFGQLLHSFNWYSAAANLPAWVLDNMAPDGTLVDFGDAWANLGYGHIVPLVLSTPRELLGLSPLSSEAPNACLTQLYFMNAYHGNGFTDPWDLPPSMARDWSQISGKCNAPAANVHQVRVYPEYGQGMIRSFVPGASAAAQSATAANPYRRQADQTYLTVNGVRNDINHREMDFAALIWTAYGNRLLFDFGYGQIVRNYFEYDVFQRLGGGLNNQIDYALAANKLIVPSAFSAMPEGWPWVRQFYTAEPYGTSGQITSQTIDGIAVILADGTNVLGGSSPAYMHRPAVSGPLQYFYRWLVPIEDGNFLVIDAFKAKPGKESRIQEFWLTNDDNSANSDICRTPLAQSSNDVHLTLPANDTILLEPVCAQVPSGTRSETIGRMKGASLAPGRFHLDIPDFLPTDAAFRSEALEIRDGITILKMRNRTGGNDRKKLFRWVPDNNVSEDVRVFLLQAATTSSGGLVRATLEQTNAGCTAVQVCFDLSVGSTDRRITLTKSTERYRLTGLR